MWKLFKLLIIAPVFLFACAHAQERKVITKDELIQMFDGMAKKTNWDLSQPMLWGYFFTDVSRTKLERAAPLLDKQGYRVVNIYLADKQHPQDPDLWWLHVEKIEPHTPDSLDQRNKTLYRFAEEQGLASYDGMDVGPVATRH